MAENNVPVVPVVQPNPQPPTFQPFSTVVNIKLDRTNYPLWLAQILPILKSRDLMGYVDGTVLCPVKHVDGSATVNPAYTTWVQQDQMILSWINGSLTASVLSVVASKRTARATWEALEQRYASTSQNRLLFLRNALLQTKKGDLSVADYLDRMNALADNLALAGQPVSDDELVQIVLNNLGPAFEMTVSAAQARDTPITYPTLESLLLTTERRLAEHTNVHSVDGTAVNAFVTSRGRGGGCSRSGGRGNSSNRGAAPRGNNLRNNNAPQNNQGNEDRFVSYGDRIVCQICGKPGHPALDCYHRMNTAFECRIPVARLSAMTSSPITLNKQQNGSWLLDTGANAHITPDLQNLLNPKEYNGNEGVGGISTNAGPKDTEDAFPREM